MVSPLNVLLCAAAATLFWTCLGIPLARRLVAERVLRLALAPVLGWAVFAPLALLIFLFVPLGRTSVAIVAGIALVASLIAWKTSAPPADADAPGIPWWAYVAAAFLAAAAMTAIMPKPGDGGVLLAAPIFDHSKVAIIDDIARLGLPAGNPFFGEHGAAGHLPYYYLWHFSAALLAVLLHVSGWEADIALTGVTAFASLALMMGLAVWFSGRRTAALWVPLLGLAGSLRPVLAAVLGRQGLKELLPPESELQTWLVQAIWAPQHLASALCAIVAVLLLWRLALRGDALVVAALALVVAAGFESSTWIGGVAFAVVAVPVCCGLLAFADPRRRVPFLIGAAVAAVLAAAIAFPFIRDEYLATLARDSGVPIALRPFEVFGTLVPASIRRTLDLPAYWLLLLVVEFPAVYVAGSLALARTVASPASARHMRAPAAALGLLTLIGFAVAWLLASTIANNDLGWRAALPGIMVLTVFAAAGFARWRTMSIPVATAAALLFLLGLPAGLGFIKGNAVGIPSSSASAFAQSPELWRAVRRYAAPDQRVGNNPLALADMTVWPINISWALLADRRSCYAAWALAQPLVAMRDAELEALDGLFTRVFAGSGSAEDVHLLATQYGCHVIVVTAQDGAWPRDPFAASAEYRLAEDSAGKWRIYVATGR